ncbi:MAG: YmdB family metallophosphoesterase [Candidatus Kerfeldbacteria bacterium]|nr:YmdB family metallophosphoesterase [Candidatus Kerfeldbacteria bacterium]
MRLLFFGDIVGKAGRLAVASVLPLWREKYQPDIIAANVDNAAHGRGPTKSTLDELMNLGVSIFMGGDHVFDNPEIDVLLADKKYPLLRPANYPAVTPGSGVRRVTCGSREILFIHLQGQVFMDQHVESPFKIVDEIIKNETAINPPSGIVVDLHAEATSEKVALGWHLAGRVTAVLGTHTHISTSDEWIMPGGTAYQTDIGMVGARHSVIGVKVEDSLRRFLTQRPARFEPMESGTIITAATLVSFEPLTGKATAIARLAELVEVS